MKNLKISLSGIRGVIGETLFYDTVLNFGLAFAGLYKGKILIARDTRPSGKKLSKALIEAIKKSGGEAVNLGIVPTPTVLLSVRRMKARGGIVITASHNPGQWNGLKFINSQGLFLNSREFRKLLDAFKRIKVKSSGIEEKVHPGGLEVSISRQVISGHIQAVLKCLDRDLIKKRQFRVGIDPVNGAGGVITRKFLEELGCRVFSINENPDGRFGRSPEPLPRNLKGLAELVKKHNLDLGFAQDPDADRLAVISERGVPIGEEYTLVLAFQDWLNRIGDVSAKKERAVVINLATTKIIDDIARPVNWKVWRTKVGEVNVVTGMKKADASFGGEGNGGVICPLINWGRDSFAGMGLILELIASARRTVSELVEKLPKYYRFNDKLKFSPLKIEKIFKVFEKKALQAVKKDKVNFTDGIRVDGKTYWWLVRLSNTEPVIRIMGEAQSRQQAEDIAGDLKSRLRKIAGENY